MTGDARHFGHTDRVRPAGCFDVLDESVSRTNQNAADAHLRRIINTYVPQSHVPLVDVGVWDASFFGLDSSRAFKSLDTASQHALLTDCGRGVFDEAIYIETAGLTYTAKMALCADSIDARALYAHFASDEARHLASLRSLAGDPAPRVREGNHFLSFLDAVIRMESPNVLVLLVQVLLEGWGIRYYSTLARDSQSLGVGECFNAIVLDEGHHHGSGLVLFDENNLNDAERARVESLVASFTSMVQAGPVGVAVRLARACGGFSAADVEQFLSDLSFEKKVAADLKILAHMLTLAGAHRLQAQLEAKGAFKVPSRALCRDGIMRTMAGVS